MIDSRFTNVIKEIRDLKDPVQLYIACTGAGAGLQNVLWSVPGCSSFLVGSAFPYAKEDSIAFLGFEPEKFCSEGMAMSLAMESFKRAYHPSRKGRPLGVGLCASVASTKAHRGSHMIHAAYFSEQGSGVRSLELAKGEGEKIREYDGAMADSVGLLAIFAGCGFPEPEVFSVDFGAHPHGLCRDVVDSSPEPQLGYPYFTAQGKRQPGEMLDSSETVFLPSALNPPHLGHFDIVEGIQKQHGKKVVFSLTVDPPHKAPVSVAEVLKRAKLVHGYDLLVSSGDPLYLDKARRHPGAGFAIGADALIRLMDPKWTPVIPMLKEFQALGTRFFVADRLVGDKFVTLSDLKRNYTIPIEYSHLFIHVEVPRRDLSSTAIRAQMGLT